MALAYDLVGDAERAIKFYKKALENDPNHKEAKHNIELLLGEPYGTDETIEYTDNIVEEKDLKEENEINSENTFN